MRGRAGRPDEIGGTEPSLVAHLSENSDIKLISQKARSLLRIGKSALETAPGRPLCWIGPIMSARVREPSRSLIGRAWRQPSGLAGRWGLMQALRGWVRRE